MGSFCTSKPVVTTKNESGSGTQSGTSSQTYTPGGLNQINDIWNQVQSVASQPYNPYGGNMVAGLSPTQQSGIANINSSFGMAQPYLNTAANYATQGAEAINPADLTRYSNPFTSSVIDATRRNFGETNAQQQQQVVGNAALQGASGGDRVRVAQAELARQQRLAQDPIIANLNSQNYSQALAAAQADRAAKGQGAFTFANLGPTAQNAALQGSMAQIQAGGLEQGTEQARLNAAYQEYLRAQAFPYQQTQMLAQFGLPLATAMGGTQSGSTSGQTTSTGMGTQQQTGGGPSPLQTIAGLGMTAAGLMTGNPFLAMGGLGAGAATGGMGLPPKGASYGSTLYKRGGRVASRFQDGGFVDAVNSIRSAIRRRDDVIDTRRDQSGTYVPDPHQGGGPYNTGGRGLDHFQVAPPMWGPNNPMTRHGYDEGGAVPGPYPGGAFGGMRGWAPGEVPMGWNDGDYDATPNQRVTDAFADAMPPPMRDDPTAPTGIALPPQVANPDGQPIMMPPQALGYAAPNPMAAPPMGAPPPPPMAMPAPQGAPQPAPSGPFGLSEDARMGLLSAGLGILASKSPHALGAIGEGGLAGVKTYGEQLKQRRSAEQEARKLAQQAQQFAQNLSLGQDRLAEITRHNQATEAQQRAAIAGGRTPPGFTRGSDGSLTAIPGGPADPDYIARVNAIRKPTGDITPAQKAVDTKFGQEYAQLVPGGGFADIQKGIEQLRGVVTDLKSSTTLTGPIVGSVPDAVGKFINPKAIAAREAVEEVVQRNLRLILGAQFTQKEGERLIARAFNPRLDEKENVERVTRLLGAMEKAYRAKLAAAKHYEEHGTMRNYKGVTDVSASDIMRDIEAPAKKPVIKTKEQYDKLQSGETFIGADGKEYTKP